MAPTASLETAQRGAAAGQKQEEAAPPAAPDGLQRKFSASKQADNSVDLFQKEWDLYQKVLLGDYLCHSAAYAAVANHFAARLAQHAAASGGGGLRVLDIGCGDAHCMARALAASGLGRPGAVASYTGVDMSAPAIAIARRNVEAALHGADPDRSASAAGAAAAAPAAVGFVEGDMLAFARAAEPQSYDLILASLAAHHLPEAQKRELLGLVGRRLLAPGGSLVLVDIFLAPGEGREGYMARFKDDLEQGYELLTPAEKASVADHGAPPVPFGTFLGRRTALPLGCKPRPQRLREGTRAPAESKAVFNYDFPWDLAATRAWASEAFPDAPSEALGRVLFEEKFFKVLAFDAR